MIWNTFEGGVGQWANRDGDVGATLSLTDAGTPDGGYCLQLTNRTVGCNFASTITSLSFDAAQYPIVQFDYKIPKDVKINLLVKVDERWYDIEFTDDPKAYRRLNMERIGRIDGVVADDAWHTASFDLYEMLRAHPPLLGRDRFIVREMIMADWDDTGYMELVYGTNRPGATYDIDNFLVRSARPPSRRIVPRLFTGLWPALGLRLASSTQAPPSLATDGIGMQGLAGIEGGWQTFQSDGFQGSFRLSAWTEAEAGGALNVEYDVSRAGEFAGIYKPLDGLDASRYRTLSFWVQGAQGGEAILVGLKHANGQEHKIPVSRYLESGITQDWQRVAIPLAAFTRRTDAAALENLSFTVEERLGSGSGTVMIDRLAFEDDSVPLRVGDCAGGPDVRAWSEDPLLFKTSIAQIDVLRDPFGCLVHYDGIVSSRDQESWAGWGVQLGGLDATGYETLVLRMKRVHGVEQPNIYLDDGTTRAYVDLEAYTAPSTEWQRVEIPLKAFTAQGLNLRHLQSLTFVLEWERMAGALYLGEMVFEPTASPRPGPAPYDS